MANREAKILFCYCHVGGKLVVNADKSVTYEGGNVDGFVIDQNTTFDAFIARVCERLQITPACKLLRYTLKFDKSCLLHLKDQQALDNFLTFNDGAGWVYVFDTEDIGTLLGSSPRHSNVDSLSASQRSVEVQHGDEDAAVQDNRTSTETPPPTLNDCDEELFSEGQQFQSPEAFQQSLYKFALAKHFRYKFVKNCSLQFDVRCDIQGCPWKLVARGAKVSGIVRVKRLINVHKHPEQSEKFESSPDYLPRAICNDVENEGFVKPRELYRLIPWMCQRILDVMPGSVASWKASEDNRFKQIFVAYSCCIRGYQLGCRPLLFIDDYYIMRPFRGTLLSVTALDANDDVFPLAFAVINSDTIDWLWFLDELKSVSGDRDTVLVFKNNGMVKEFYEVFGAENHCFSYSHIKEKFASFVEQVDLGQNGKKNAVALLNTIMHSRLHSDYENALQMMYQFNADLYNWVLTNSPNHWANSQFKRRRWDKFDSDFEESFNSWIVNASHVPLFEFITSHQHKLAEILHERQKDLATWTAPVGEKIKLKVEENTKKSQDFVLLQVLGPVFQFQSDRSAFEVDLAKGLCTCLEWQMTGIPCPHACGAIKWANIDVYHFVEKVYHKESQKSIYAELLQSVPTDDLPCDDTPGGENGAFLLRPPATPAPRGRPPKNTVNSQASVKRTILCTFCNEVGHIRRACKERRALKKARR